MPMSRLRCRLSSSAGTAVICALAAVGALAVIVPVAASTGTFTQPEPITTDRGSAISGLSATGAGKAIPDASGASSGVATSAVTLGEVPNIPDATATRVEVEVTAGHGSFNDLDLVLVAPDGRAVTLASDIGGANGATATMNFSDDAASPLSAAAAESADGAPTDYDTPGDLDDHPGPAPTSLRALGGAPAGGDWTLYAYDDTVGHTGSIVTWRLYVDFGTPAAPSHSPLAVSGLPRNVTDVNLALHDVRGTLVDTEFLLESPDGRYAHVLSDSADFIAPLEDVDVLLDDEATADFPRSGSPISGRSYRPVNYDADDQSEFFGGADTMGMDARLSAFDGGPANGTWKLWVFREYCCTTTTIGGWSLQVTAENPPAAPPPGTPPAPAVADTTSPTIARTTPSHRAKSVRTGRSLKVTFSEAIRATSLTARTIKVVSKAGKRVRVDLTYQTGQRLLVVEPRKDLAAGTTYTLTVGTGARDLAGNALAAAKRVRFRTR